MNAVRVAPAVGVVGCLAVLASLAAPFVLLVDPGTGLGLYYAAGPVGGAGIAFLSLLAVVAFLAGARGRTDEPTAAGIALVVSAAALLVAALWATSVDQEVVFSFTSSWMGWHRWLVVSLGAIAPLGAAVYARAVL